MLSLLPLITGASLCLSVISLASPRDVQFRSVDFTTSIVELHNFGDTTESLNGWRFCSHDDNQDRQYSSRTGLNGLSIAPGASLWVHYLNDAPAGEADRINISGRGNFATPLDRGPYGLQIYFPVNNVVRFSNGNTIADHLQWSIDGAGDLSASNRSSEAQSGGVWTNQNLWISTTNSSSLLILNDTTGSVLHGPDDYTVDPVIAPEPFVIDSISLIENGDVTLTWPVEAGANYEIWRAINLNDFVSIGTTTEGFFTDTAVPNERAFYQVSESFPE